MKGNLIFKAWISAADLAERPDAVFVFGDNMIREGFGGQAATMRGKRNALGIPTKWSPSNAPSAFFRNSDLSAVKSAIDEGFAKLEEVLRAGGDVIWPRDGIGTGLAALPKRAPAIHEYILERLAKLLPLANVSTEN